MISVAYMKEEPSRISRIEPRVIALIMQIRNETVSHDLCELYYDLFRLFPPDVCRKKESLQGDKGVSSPASHVASRKVRKPCS